MADTHHPLDALTDLLPGFAFRGAIQDEPAGPVRVVTMANVQEDTLCTNQPLPAIAFAGDKNKLRIEPGDLIFRARGVSNQAILVESIQQPAIFASPLIRIRVRDTQTLNPHYLRWLLNSGPIQRAIDAIAKGTIVRMISAAGLRDLSIPVPPLQRQQQIAAFAHLQREEQQLSEALIRQRRHFAEQVLWAKAQEA